MLNSSSVFRITTLLVLVGVRLSAHGQQRAQGFGVERFSPSPVGSGWLLMNDLASPGELGGALALTSGYAHNPLALRDRTTRVAVISDQAFLNFGAAVVFRGFRLSLDAAMPLIIRGTSGTVKGTTFSAPSVSLGSNPDSLTDIRVGADARLLGQPGTAFRLGVSARLFIPSGNRDDYATDGTYRGMLHALVAGDVARFAYAAEAGVHIRPLEPSSGGPQGSELLCGVAGGIKFELGKSQNWSLVIGPEVVAATALRAMFAQRSSGVEVLASARLETHLDDTTRLRAKLGLGLGLGSRLGVPEWRVVLGIELGNTARPL